MESLGERIKQIRLLHNLSQENFGKRLGLSHSHISKIENSKENPSDTLMRLIVHEFQVNHGWLQYGNGSMSSTLPPELCELGNQFAKDGQQFIGKQIEKIHQTFIASDDYLCVAHPISSFLNDTISAFTAYGTSKSVNMVIAGNLKDIMNNINKLVCLGAEQSDKATATDELTLLKNYIAITENVSTRLKEIFELADCKYE